MKTRSIIAIGAIALAGCASTIYNVSNPSLMLAGTPGEYFRQYLKKRDAECRELQLGPYMPSDIPPHSPLRGNASCSFLFLKPWQPGDSPESAYAHSLKLPPPHDKPVDVYKPGMSPQEYFEALCKAQAGEFIFKRVEGVVGIVELRPRGPESSEMNRHLTAFEDPATFAISQALASVNLTLNDLYRFVETKIDGKLTRVSQIPGQASDRRNLVPITAYSARYGFVWRGIFDERQINLGIGGGEMLIVDLQTNEVIALKRAFKYRWLGRFPTEQAISVTGFEWGRSCEQDIRRNQSRTFRDFSDFVLLALPPSNTSVTLGVSK